MVLQTSKLIDNHDEFIHSLSDTTSALLLHDNQSMHVVIGVYQYLISDAFLELSPLEQESFYSILLNIIDKVKEYEYATQTNEIRELITNSMFDDLKQYITKITLSKYIPITTLKTESKKNKSTEDLSIYNKRFKDNYITLADNSEISSSTNVSLNNYSYRMLESPMKLVNDDISQNYSKTTVEPMKVIINKQLPLIVIGVTATLSSQQYIDIVNRALTQLEFDQLSIQKKNDNCYIAVYEYIESNCLRRLWDKVLYCKKSYGSMKIQVGIGVAQSTADKYSRMIEIKSISGTNNDLEDNYTRLVKKIVLYMNKIKILKIAKWKHIVIKTEIAKYLNKIQSEDKKTNPKVRHKNHSELIETDINDYSFVEETNKEALKFYEIYKILSRSNYGVGQSLLQFMTQLKDENTDIIEAKIKIPTQMKSIANMIEDTVVTFTNSFNNCQKTNESMKYIRPATEKFVFNKIYYMIFEIYKERYKEDNEAYIKQKTIINRKSIKEIMDHLEIKSKFQGKDAFNPIPYKVSIDLINQIEYEQIPRAKLETLMKSSLEMRNTILSITSGKTELESMDDELPLFMYLATQINNTNILAELHFIDDYLRYSSKDDSDTKVITNLFSSIHYITNTWNQDSLIKK